MEFYRAIKYIRLSYTDDRNMESDSVGNQRRMIDDFIAKHPEIDAVAEKIDDGYSGVLFDRPAFQENDQGDDVRGQVDDLCVSVGSHDAEL